MVSPLVNVYIANWRITIFLGKSSINCSFFIAMFLYWRVFHSCLVTETSIGFTPIEQWDGLGFWGSAKIEPSAVIIGEDTIFTMWCPSSLANWFITSITMVYGRYIELVNGLYKPTNITGGHNLFFFGPISEHWKKQSRGTAEPTWLSWFVSLCSWGGRDSSKCLNSWYDVAWRSLT